MDIEDISQLNEQERVDRVRGFFKENWTSIVGGVLLAVVVVGAWWGYKGYQQGVSESAATLFNETASAFGRKDLKATASNAEKLTKEYDNTEYAPLAQIYLARLEVDAGKVKEAEARLSKLKAAGGLPNGIGQLVSMTLARLYLGQGKADKALETLKSPPPGGYVALYEELRGDAYLASNRLDDAKKAYKAAVKALKPDDRYRTVLNLKLHGLGEAV